MILVGCNDDLTIESTCWAMMVSEMMISLLHAIISSDSSNESKKKFLL
jgi:hypothetical protein